MNKTNERMRFDIPRDLWVLMAAMLVWGVGEGLFIFFYPLSLQRWEIDSVQIGAILSILGVAMALVQVPSGYLSDRFGPRPLILSALILGVAAAVIMSAAQTLSVFVIGLIAYSFTSFVVAPLNSYITSARGSLSVQRAMTLISGAFQLGAIAGPILGGWIGQTYGLSMVFRFSAALFLIATIITFFIKRQVAEHEERDAEKSIARPFANMRLMGLLVLIFLTIIMLSMPQQLTSIYLQEEHQLSIQQIGMTGTFAGIGTSIILFALGNISTALGMMAGQLLIGIFSLIMWRGQSAPVFYLGYLFIGGYRLYHSMALAFAQTLVKSTNMGLAYGLVETCNALAVILAPLAAGFLYDNKPELVYTVSLISLTVTIILTYLMTQKMNKITPT
jgi:MFS family permease